MRSPAVSQPMWRWLLVAVSALLAACGSKKPPTNELLRCEFDVMSRSDLFTATGTGAAARKVEAASDLIGGQFAGGRLGDYVLENDKIRAIIGQPGRDLFHVPFGGHLIDADVKRGAGEAGRDQLGKLGLIYSFGRAVEVKEVEVLRDGAAGGPAIIAATGIDQLNDMISIQANIDKMGLGLKLAIDPEKPVPLRTTHYYVLSPGESRVRMLTAMCNESTSTVVTTLGDISAGGGTMDLFNPEQCRGALGEGSCLIDPSPWFGWQGDGVAYGYRSYAFSDLVTPDTSAMVYLSGSVASMAGIPSLQGLLSWLGDSAGSRPGRVVIKANESAVFLRDLQVGRSLAEITAGWQRLDGTSTVTQRVNVTETGAGPLLPGVRVAVENEADLHLVTLAVTNSQGFADVQLIPGQYRFSTGADGHQLQVGKVVTVTSPGPNPDVDLQLGASRKLTVTVADPRGAPLPGKVVVRCKPAPCPTRPSSLKRFSEIEDRADELALVDYVPPGGTGSFSLPPGTYEVMVTHGPEYSAWPDTVPTAGAMVDLTTADQSLAAVVERVVDTTGWLSSDLHVHSVFSADSSAPADRRVLAFAAEQVEVMVGTDHDYVTDYAPLIDQLGARPLMTSIIGDEMSPNFGHHNAFPLQRDVTENGGAPDWAGGTGPTLRPAQFYQLVRENTPGAIVQVNHPRSGGGLFENIKLDTLTGATHLDPALQRMAPAPDATPDDTRLFSPDFDCIEVQNGFTQQNAPFNDWLVFLSRGLIKTATAVSDTHDISSTPAGYGRTYVKSASDSVAGFENGPFIEALRGHRAFGTNTPFVRFTAQALDGAGAPTGTRKEIGDTLSVAGGARVRFEVNVQAPEWIQFDTIDLITHGAGRESSNGVANTKWPTPVATKTLDPKALTIEAVPGAGSFRRVNVTATFDVTVAADTWFVAVVRGSGASRDLFPMAFRPSCSGTTCTISSSKVFAYTNAILIDGDGSGAYDTFPLKQGLRVGGSR